MYIYICIYINKIYNIYNLFIPLCRRRHYPCSHRILLMLVLRVCQVVIYVLFRYVD